jgi:hypothetical protein
MAVPTACGEATDGRKEAMLIAACIDAVENAAMRTSRCTTMLYHRYKKDVWKVNIP